MKQKKSSYVSLLWLVPTVSVVIALALISLRGTISLLYPAAAAIGLTVCVIYFLKQWPRAAQKETEFTALSTKHLRYVMPDQATASLILNKILFDFDEDGFFISKADLPGSSNPIYHLRKNESLITLWCSPQELVFECSALDAASVKTAFYEALAEIEEIKKYMPLLDAEKAAAKNAVEDTSKYVRLSFFLKPTAVEVNLKGKNKSEIMEELVDVLIRSGRLNPSKREQALKDLWERENTMSTGLQDGVALPHAKTGAVNYMISAVGVKKASVDFNSIDGKPSNIFVMTLSSKAHHEPYLQFIAEINRVLVDPENRTKVLACSTSKDLYKLLTSAF